VVDTYGADQFLKSQPDSRAYLVIPRISLILQGLAILFIVGALFNAVSGDYTLALLGLYLAAYLGHGFVLPKPYVEVTARSLVVRTPYHRYAIPWTEIRGTREAVWPRMKGLKGFVWSILTLQIEMKPIPTLVLDLDRPRWTVIGILVPPIAFPLKTTSWEFFRSDEFDEFFGRISARIALQKEP
jgi:hypothetical protein